MEKRLRGACRGVCSFLIFQINMFDIKNIQLTVQMRLSVSPNYTDFTHNYRSYKLISFHNVQSSMSNLSTGKAYTKYTCNGSSETVPVSKT